MRTLTAKARARTRAVARAKGHSPGAVCRVCGEQGMVLVLTLMILVLITAMVTEFAYGVYTSTSALHNWKEAQRLSFAAKSGVSLAVKTIADPQVDLYKFPGKMVIPVDNILEGFTGSVVVTVEDENARLNLNSVLKPDGLKMFKRLLKNLGLDESIADRVADWIDADSNPRLKDSEEGTKNAYMDSSDELLLVKGMDVQTYETLMPYVTVYGFGGTTDDLRVNINTASIPVIMSLNEGISRERAEEIVNQRKIAPFRQTGELGRAGIDNDIIRAIQTTATAGPAATFRITSVAEYGGIKRVIESVAGAGGSGQVRYWREM